MIPRFVLHTRVVLASLVAVMLCSSVIGLVEQSTVRADSPSAISVMADQTKKWLSFRALYGCVYDSRFKQQLSSSDVIAGKIFDGGTTALGYEEPSDGKVSCDDEGMVSNRMGIIGFKGVDYAYCAAQPGAGRIDGPDTVTTNNFTGCVNGSGKFSYDKDIDQRKTADSWFSGLKKVVPSYTSYMTSDGGQFDQSKYYMYFQTVVTQCGAKSQGAYDGSARSKSIVDGDDHLVVMNLVDGAGQITPTIYKLSKKKQTDSVGDVYNNLDGSSSHYTCEYMAHRTFDLDTKAASFITTYNDAHPDAPTDDLVDRDPGGGDGGDKTTCGVDGIGWIVCPVMNFLAKVNDTSYDFLQDLLTVRPELTQSKGLTSAWSSFRDFANVAFVIAFLIIIYSQLTGAGVTNYGLKKLLPKLIIAAILVNLSYVVCAIAVDISNIVGSSIYSLFKGFADTNAAAAGASGGETWTKLVGGALIVGGGVVLIVAIVLAPSILLALALVILILVARQAFVILLIVLSPLAFVAYLLPNTESWFKKWWKAFSVVLMVFPIVGLVFGASRLASQILMSVADTTDNANMFKLVALAVMGIPLFAIPSLLKGSLAAAGSIGGKIAGMQDKASGRAMRGIKDGRLGEAKNAYDARKQRNKVDRRLNGGYLGKGRIGKRVAAIGDKRGGKIGGVLKAVGAPGRTVDNSAAAGYLGADKGAARATAQFDEDYESSVKDANTRLQASMSHEQILAASGSGKHVDGRKMNEHERDAAIRYTMDRGNFEERAEAIKGVGNMTRTQRKSLANGLRSKGDTSVYGNKAIANIEATELPGMTGMSAGKAEDELFTGTVDKINKGELSPETITKDHRITGHVLRASMGSDATVTAKLKSDIKKYKDDNPQAWTKLDPKTRERAEAI